MKNINIAKITFILSIIFLTFIFIFTKHYIDLSETIEPWLAYKGLAYYKDFSVYHFPLGRISMLPIHQLFNWTFIESPFIGLFMGLGILSLLYYLGKKLLSQNATAVSLIFFTIFWWYVATQVIYDHEMMMGLFLACSLVTFFDIFKSSFLSLKKLFLLGMFSALTLLTGQLAGLTVAAVILLTLMVVKSKKYTNKITFLKSIFFVSLGFAIPWVILILYLLKIGALWEFYYYTIHFYYFTYAAYPKPSLLQLPWRDLAIYYSPLLVLMLLSSLNYLKTRKINFTELILITLSMATLPFNLLSVFHPRHLLYSLPVVALTAGFVIDNKSVQSRIKNKVIYLWFILVSLMFVSVLYPYYKNHLIYPPTLKIFNNTYPGDNVYETADWLKNNTPKNTTIMVLGTPTVYVRADRLPASRPSRGIPYSWEPIDEVRKELQAKPPDYWIVDQQFIIRIRTNYSKLHVLGYIDNEMLHCYNLVKSFNKWQIWKRDLSCKITI